MTEWAAKPGTRRPFITSCYDTSFTFQYVVEPLEINVNSCMVLALIVHDVFVELPEYIGSLFFGVTTMGELPIMAITLILNVNAWPLVMPSAYRTSDADGNCAGILFTVFLQMNTEPLNGVRLMIDMPEVLVGVVSE